MVFYSCPEGPEAVGLLCELPAKRESTSGSRPTAWVARLTHRLPRNMGSGTLIRNMSPVKLRLGKMGATIASSVGLVMVEWLNR